MSRLLIAIAVVCITWTLAAAQQRKQEPKGTAEKIGEQIDRGLSQLGSELSEAWSEVRRGVDRMGVQGRVYGRLHWDKALQGADLDITVRDTSTIILTGRVPTDAAKAKAEELAESTIGVSSVVNELRVAR